MRDAGRSDQGSGYERVSGHDLCLLLGRVQAEVRQQPTTVHGQVRFQFMSEARNESVSKSEEGPLRTSGGHRNETSAAGIVVCGGRQPSVPRWWIPCAGCELPPRMPWGVTFTGVRHTTSVAQSAWRTSEPTRRSSRGPSRRMPRRRPRLAAGHDADVHLSHAPRDRP